MKLIIRWIINAVTLVATAQVLEGLDLSGWYAAFIAALVLGLVNAVIRPVILFLTLPINILTLGLFTLVINGLMFWFVSSIVKGFDVAGFGPAFIGALVLSVISVFVGWALKDK
ncbi:phage holin family protein [Candidatus Nomurabacteria bacterium]|nr:phage holin family protein [Candidatus Nomurabacteria bacterium]